MLKIQFIVFSVLQLVFPALSFSHENQYDMWPGMMGWGHSMGWPMMFFMFLFWAVVLAGIVALVRLIFSRGGKNVAQPTETALDILKKQYAKGEIDKDTFEEKKRVIEE